MTVKKLLARLFNNCESCGKRLKADEQKYTVRFEVWIEPGKSSGYECTVCHECINNFKLYELVSKVNVLHKLMGKENQ